MRDVWIWSTGAVLLITALHTVHVRTEVYDLARRNGSTLDALQEQKRVHDNLEIAVERESSPRRLRERAEHLGIQLDLETFPGRRTSARLRDLEPEGATPEHEPRSVLRFAPARSRGAGS